MVHGADITCDGSCRRLTFLTERDARTRCLAIKPFRRDDYPNSYPAAANGRAAPASRA